MKIRVEEENDQLFINGEDLVAIVQDEKYTFKVSEIEAVMIITTNMGPVNDDECLAIRIDNETAVFIMSSHPMFDTFLFEQLGKTITLDYDNIISAASCTENKVFPIYNK